MPTGSTGINNAFSSNKYFTVEDKKATVFGISNLASPYSILTPKGSGLVDVTNTMRWSNYSNVDEVPSVFVTERVLKLGTWAANILEILEQAKNFTSGKDIDSYVSLYAAEKTGFWYNFPYLLKNGDTINSISNKWKSQSGIGSIFSGGSDSGGSSKSSKLGAIAGIGAQFATPGFGFEETQQFDNTDPQVLTIEFPLYNTISQEDAFNHFSFVNLFAFQNLKTRTSLMTYIPPKIYTVDAFTIGGKYMAVAYVQDFKVESIGVVRKLKDYSKFGPKEILIPEAYKVKITFADLLSQSSNVFAAVMGGSKIDVANAPTTLTQGFQDAVQTVGNVIKGTITTAEKIGKYVGG
jgi:hypothetical protein